LGYKHFLNNSGLLIYLLVERQILRCVMNSMNSDYAKLVCTSVNCESATKTEHELHKVCVTLDVSLVC